ncbi:MAG: histidine kinase, partial [Gammaproteobacteria bacterium]|nr:histidine kinase [Gammaproteobacteria bacterium]
MQGFLLGYGVGDGLQAARQCLERIGTPPPEANLGFLYATDALAPELDAILEYLKRETRIAHWVGSVGIGICCSGREFYDAKALTVMVASFPHEAFHVLPTIKGGLQAFQEHDAWSRQSNARLGVVHGDPHNASTPELIVRLADHLPGGFLVGGLTSSNG